METPTSSPRGRSVRQPVLLGLFIGLAVGVGYLLAGVPGVELMTLVTALAGLSLGARSGALVGALAALVYSVGSPYGVPLPPILAAQVLGMAAAGVLGGLLAVPLARTGSLRGTALLAGCGGAAAAIFFDVITNLAIALAYDTPLAAVAAMAATMFLIHLAVNTAVFAVVVPAALPRLANLARGGLVGRGTAPGLALAVLVAVASGSAASAAEVAAPADSLSSPLTELAMAAAGDSTASAPADTLRRLQSGPVASDTPAGRAMGWQRPLWTPFAATALRNLDWYSPRTTVVEAAVGGPAVILGEAGSDPVPLVTVDGVPWNLGHALVDDPWLLPSQGLDLAADTWYEAAGGGTSGALRLETHDPEPDKASSQYRGVKGKHESYMRAVHVLTARASWRAGFAFEESMDQEVYNYSDQSDGVWNSQTEEFPGHGRVRQSRVRLEKHQEDGQFLRLDLTNGRKSKDDVPAWDAEHAEVWSRGVAATWRANHGRVAARTILHWGDRDVQWGEKPQSGADIFPNRKVEVQREGVTVDVWRRDDDDTLGAVVEDPGAWNRRGGALRLEMSGWRVADSGDTLASLPVPPESVRGRGRDARGVVTLGGGSGVRWRADLGGAWDGRAGGAPLATLAVGADAPAPWWRLTLSRDGRAPRSDELLTPLHRDGGAGGNLTILPNADLGRENLLRGGVTLSFGLLGNVLAVDAAARRLTDGITWSPLEGDPDTGRWHNGLEMDSARVTASISREGRLLGWARARLEGTWRQFDEKKGQAAFLPPEESLRLHLLWENHFFEEDGILQLGLISTVRGEMDDPWDVSRGTLLPRRTVHDLLLGFRLVGAQLSMAITNLTGDRVQMSRNTWSPGQEIDMRLSWSFRY